MRKKRRRDSTPAQRVVKAKECAGELDIDFDYDETTEVLRLTLDELRRTSREGIEKVKGAAKTLRDIQAVVLPEKAKAQG